MTKEEVRQGIKRYSQKQTEIAKEMEVSPIYLNEFLNGAEYIGNGFLKKAEVWLEQQIKTD